MKSLSLLYLDDHFAIVNKPSGLLVHRSMLDREETFSAMQVLRDQLGRWVYPVHRLDKATSGALVFGLNKDTARLMMEIIAHGKVSKSYVAVVRGYTREAERIDYPLREEGRMSQRGDIRHKPAQEAVTEYRRLGTVELPVPVGRYATARYSLIQARPLTGRTHQLRRHMKHIFHPIIGDTTHGDGKQNDFIRRQFHCRRLLLHSREIEFVHPVTGQPVRAVAPLDEAFAALIQAMEWDRIAVLSGDSG